MDRFGPVKVSDTVATFNTRIITEYDGLVLFEITADSPNKLSLDSLRLEIPVKAGKALYRHLYGSTEILPPSGNVPAGNGVVEKTSWIPYAWLGDNDRGLFWFCESDEMWPNRAVMQLKSCVLGNEIAIRLNILQRVRSFRKIGSSSLACRLPRLSPSQGNHASGEWKATGLP